MSTIVPFLMYSNTPADEYWISQQNFTFLQYIRSISESDGSHPRLIPHHFLVLRTSTTAAYPTADTILAQRMPGPAQILYQ